MITQDHSVVGRILCNIRIVITSYRITSYRKRLTRFRKCMTYDADDDACAVTRKSHSVLHAFCMTVYR